MGERGGTGRPFTAVEKAAMGFAALVMGLVCFNSCGGDDGASEGDAESTTSAAAVGGAESSHMRPVVQSGFSEWPFTVASGTLRCRSGSEVTFEPAGGPEYAVNGTAKGAGYPPITPIWADDEDLGYGLKVDISEVLAAGRSLC
ncbi:hypothetical protein [Streptomyces sp. NPDC057253]|uniref:hypothetical protein n=1 Tax=Streptomyces sp. NPDC057253 TaxID=3346069 RepID=UPI0036286C2A